MSKQKLANRGCAILVVVAATALVVNCAIRLGRGRYELSISKARPGHAVAPRIA